MITSNRNQFFQIREQNQSLGQSHQLGHRRLHNAGGLRYGVQALH